MIFIMMTLTFWYSHIQLSFETGKPLLIHQGIAKLYAAVEDSLCSLQLDSLRIAV
jgi:hypothetical protein